MFETVFLVAFLKFAPLDAPNFTLESFTSQKACMAYKTQYGWGKARQLMGIGSPYSTSPITWVKLECVSKI